jgi:hypothetical protein
LIESRCDDDRLHCSRRTFHTKRQAWRASAAEAFAVEEFPAIRTLGAWMRVEEERFYGDDIRRLCESNSYPQPPSRAEVRLIADRA